MHARDDFRVGATLHQQTEQRWRGAAPLLPGDTASAPAKHAEDRRTVHCTANESCKSGRLSNGYVGTTGASLPSSSAKGRHTVAQTSSVKKRLVREQDRHAGVNKSTNPHHNLQRLSKTPNVSHTAKSGAQTSLCKVWSTPPQTAAGPAATQPLPRPQQGWGVPLIRPPAQLQAPQRAVLLRPLPKRPRSVVGSHTQHNNLLQRWACCQQRHAGLQALQGSADGP